MYACQARYDENKMSVVVGLALDDRGDVLMPRRLSSGLRPDLYELPGGKVEPQETHEDALKREWREELGVDITVLDRCLSKHAFQLEQDFTVYLYPVDFKGVPQALRSKALRWLDPQHAIRNVPCVPSTYVFYRDIMKWRLYQLSKHEHGLSWVSWCQHIHYTEEDLVTRGYSLTTECFRPKDV